MGKAKFTPAPWAVNPAVAQVDALPSRVPVCQLLWPTDLRTESETEANAHLIAAAPDLYEALESITGEAGFEGLPESKQDAIHAALAKARGVA